MKSKLEIYALAVCFAAVVCLIISFGVVGYAAFRVVLPEITIDSYSYDRLQSNEAYSQSKRSCEKDADAPVKKSEEALTKERLSELSRELKKEKREGFNTMLVSFMFILTSTIALLIHARIAKKAREA